MHELATANLLAEEGDTDSEPIMPLEVRGLTYEASGKCLINDIDFTLTSDGITMIIGPNGAGKSLLVRLLHGLIVPKSGTIKWGRDPLNAAVRLRQAMMFQRPVLLRRSVRANIDFVLRLRGAANNDRRETLLRDVGLLDKASQPARLLSGGEQQRLALARALALRPEVLFLDEPTASLDPPSVLMIENILKRSQESGTKVIFITHDLAQAKRLATDIIFLHRGQLTEHSGAKTFFDNPKSAPAQGFLAGRIVI